MIPTWTCRVAKMMDNRIETRLVISDTLQHFQGVSAVDIVAAMQEIEKFNKAVHEIEMSRMARLGRTATPYNNSLFMDS